MKKIILTAIAAAVMFLGGAFSANAQGFGGPGGPGGFDFSKMAEMRANQMKESVKLTDDQYTKILDIFKKEQEEMEKMMQGGAGGQMPDFEAIQARMQKQEEAIKAVLTEDQFKAWQKEQEAMRANFGGGGFGGF